MTLTLLALFACDTAPPAPEPPPEPTVVDHAALDLTDASTCATCHPTVVKTWEQSMHSRAHREKDPIFAGMLALRQAKQGEAVAERCQTCHNPMARQAPDSPAGKAGVGCAACHDAASIQAGTKPDPRTLCLTCHDATRNGADVPTCTTGPENQEAGGLACAACHMPPGEEGVRLHTFQGPHRAWYQDDPSLLTSALTVQLERQGDTVQLTVTNTTGHAFPTGFPGRVAAVRLTGSDGFQGGTDDLLFRKVYVDGEGQPTLPPFAKALKLDSRLQPGETRSASVTVPVGTTDLRAELVFRLVPPPAVGPLGLEGRPEAEPRVFTVATLP